MSRLLLVDASIYVFRAYYSMPSRFVSATGEINNAVHGYTGFLLDLLDQNPELISVAFDASLVSCYRNRIYPEYKANRELPDENLLFQFSKCQEITSLLGLHWLSLEDFEADDIIGTLARRFGAGREVVIVTRDKDLGQLLRPEDCLWDFAADDYLGQDDIRAKFGVSVDQMADYLALAGDSVDNIPGARGIGAKTAATLLQKFGSLEQLLQDPEAVLESGVRGAKTLSNTLAEQAELIRMYREVTGIHCDVPMDVTLSMLTPGERDTGAIEAFCDDMAFGARLRKRLTGR